MDSQAQSHVLELPAFTLIGIATYCSLPLTPELSAAIGKSWETLFSDPAALPPFRHTWGLCLPGDGAGFTYVAGLVVDSPPDPLPAGFSTHEVAAARYASFPFRGKPLEMSAYFARIYKELLPLTGLTPRAGQPDIEAYGPEPMDEATGELICDIYVPVA